MAARRETPCTKDIVDSLNEHGVFFKIPDAGLQARFACPKPYDVVGHIKGRYISIEVKYGDRLRPFGLKELADHQIDALWKDKCSGADAYVILAVKPTRSTPKYKRVSYRLYVFCISELLMEERFTTAQMEQRAYIEAQMIVEVYTNKAGKEGSRRAWRFPSIWRLL